jgi:BirA family biotin operon repressor/biotin-[acetyl-CoA-carboxylase] ligase
VGLDDLSTEGVSEALAERAVRVYPALLSTGADALAWARAGAPEGAVVVAEYQASPRGRGGLEWRVEPGVTLAFSLILRPAIPAEREGWMYTVASSGVADTAGSSAAIAWPDEIVEGESRVAAVGIDVELGPHGCEWAVVNVLIPKASRPRVALLRDLVDAIEARYRSTPEDVLADYLNRLTTIGRRVRARLIPLGPSGPQVTGIAVGALMDGALLIETDGGRRVAVRPQNLGLLEEVHDPDETSSG